MSLSVGYSVQKNTDWSESSSENIDIDTISNQSALNATLTTD